VGTEVHMQERRKNNRLTTKTAERKPVLQFGRKETM
jgi:hypothetical protein